MKTTGQYRQDHGRLRADADLGLAILIAETEDSHYEPIGPVATIDEACQIARRDWASRVRRFEQGENPACPGVYKVWARNGDGEYSVVCEMDAGTIQPAWPKDHNPSSAQGPQSQLDPTPKPGTTPASCANGNPIAGSERRPEVRTDELRVWPEGVPLEQEMGDDGKLLTAEDFQRIADFEAMWKSQEQTTDEKEAGAGAPDLKGFRRAN